MNSPGLRYGTKQHRRSLFASGHDLISGNLTVRQNNLTAGFIALQQMSYAIKQSFRSPLIGKPIFAKYA
ncbi:hypothetical protein THS27_08390 [Thalassospira sp. MCCC 1A01428]|nr:hypothetical protein THS27_08390 [Thalassospira sp. MCCC 1A01428]